ncbi:hypothetical protein J4526_07030 [Desulfurococcaceae archaeon MEX13E-LK6-19]|nr:hypothetical protein J4526_07030 [Desulfurococcaceae archaeon MEX13E-LK6-19]
MPVYLVEMWIPKDGMEKQCLELSRKILEYVRSHRDEFKEMKSLRLFRVFIGGKPYFITVQEYEDLKSMEELDKKIMENQEYVRLIMEWKKCIDETQTQGLLLFDVLRELWLE